MKAKVTWVLIANGAQARVLEHKGPESGLVPVDGESFSQEPLRNQDIVTDRPGRSFASAGYGRSAMVPQTDPVQYREAEFMRHVAAALDDRQQAGAFDRLIIAAAPTALGDIRTHLTDNVKKTILAELPKDLTNVPTHQLARHFEDILAV